jgi:hypothetical protein
MARTVSPVTLVKSIVIGAIACLLAPSFVLVPIADAVSNPSRATPAGVIFAAGGLAIAWIAVRAWLRTRHNPEPGIVGALGRHGIWIMAAGLGIAIYLALRVTHVVHGSDSGGAVAATRCDDTGSMLMLKLAKSAQQMDALQAAAPKVVTACTADRWSPEAIECFADRERDSGLHDCADLLTPAQRASVPELIEALQ